MVCPITLNRSFKNLLLSRSSGSAISSFSLPAHRQWLFERHFALQLRLQQGSHTLFPLHRTVSQLNFLYHIAFCCFCQEKSARECYFKAMSCQSTLFPLHRTVSQLNFLYHIAFCCFCQEKSARECYFKAMSCQSSFCPCSAESALTSSSVRYSGDILCISAFTSGCVKGR